VSAPEKLMKGNTVSLTETDFSVSYENLISLNFYSSMSQVAYFAKGCPIDLLTNGTVLEARGLTSIRKISSSLTVNCMFINPFTLSSLARIYPLFFQSSQHIRSQVLWWQNTSAVSRINPSVFHMFYDSSHFRVSSVTQ